MVTLSPRASAALLATTLAVLAAAVLPGAASAAQLLGNATVGTNLDSNSAGLAEAFTATATTSGSLEELNLYLDSSSRATKVTLGIYSDASSHPRTLLAQGSTTTPVTGWNKVVVPPTTITAGTRYWLVLLGTGGTIAFRAPGPGAAAETSSQSTLTTMPATWTSGASWPGSSASFYGATASGPPPPPPDASTIGQWSPLMNWGIVAAHSILMRTGKFLVMDGWIAPNPARVFDPATGSLTAMNNPLGLDVFCSGNATLPDGRVVLAGGHGFSGTIGIDATTIFDPGAEAWSAGPKMADARWYPSLTELGDGRLVAISGNITATTWADTPEIFDGTTNKWTRLTGVSTSQVHEEEYPLSYLLPDGKIFTMAASTGKGYELDPVAQTWGAVGGTTLINGSAAMYRPGKILYSGGGGVIGTSTAADTRARTIDLTSPSPAWQTTQDMHAARYAHTLTVLPDGKVLAVGGGVDMDQTDVSTGERSAEIWDPATGAWTTVAPADAPRVYHSTAVLMPDGRVLVAGGGAAEGPNSPGEPTAQYYSPPYLFNGARPTISSAPSTAKYGSTISVSTPDATSIKSAALVSLGADTHTLDMNQHYVPLSFTASSGALSIDVPNAPNTIPPGYYMLFLVNDKGVPAVAPFIQVNRDSTPPTVSITSPSGGTVSGGVSLAADATDAAGIRDVQFTVDGQAVGPPDTTAPYTATWDTTAFANGPHTIGARATNTAGVGADAAPVSVSVANTAPAGVSVDANTSIEGQGKQTTQAFSTTQPDVLVAFASSDGPLSPAQTLTVSGAGLTWSLVKRVNAQGGTTELWTAKAPAALTNATVSATQAQSGFNQTLTVVAFAGAKGIGASATANARTSAPSVSITPTATGSFIYGAGNDYDRAVSRTVGTGQVMVHQWLDTAIGDTYWVQRRTSSPPAGTAVTINDTAPTGDRWNMAALEVLAQ